MDKLPFENIKREILIKRESETNFKYGCYPQDRPVRDLINYGVININKPTGPTSHQVSDYVKRILNIDKAGHSGTLDPNVSGILLVALGRATRINEVLLKAGKEYVCLMHLHKNIDEEDIYETFDEFRGKIRQLPPVKSAVKRQLRTREIYYLEILEIKDNDVLFKVGCQAGTYIRKLVHDFGQKLGVGAHMVQLIRTKLATFTDKDWVSLHDLKDAYELYKEGNEKELKKIILPIEKAVEFLPKIYVLDSSVDSLCHGANLSLPGVSKLDSGIREGETVAIMSLKNELVCLGTILLDSNSMIKKNNVLAVKINKVFMLPNTYPRFMRK